MYKRDVSDDNILNLNEYIEKLKENEIGVDFVPAPSLQEKSENIEIAYVTYDSREIVENSLFICKGNNFKVEYLEQAKAKGAVAYLADKDYGVDLPLIKVDNLRRSIAVCVSTYFSNPEKKLNFIGVTGTKGKSTTVSLIFEMLKAQAEAEGKVKPGLISSLGNFDGVNHFDSNLTTPEPMEMFYLLYRAVQNNVKNMVIEVSSQALKYDRVYGMHFEIGVFTNIAPDHISDVEHPNFEDYLQSKLKLLERSDIAVLNESSDYLDEQREAARNAQEIFEIATELNEKTKSNASDFEVYIRDIELEQIGMDFTAILKNSNREFRLNTKLEGIFNLENIAQALVVAELMNVDESSIKKGLALVQMRDRTIDVKSENDNDNVIFHIDAAHNGISFEAVFDHIKHKYPEYKRVAVFGTVGNKAENRREGMALACNGRVDEVYITRDDNDFESLDNIFDEIVIHLDPDLPVTRIDERTEAIQLAFNNAMKLWENKGIKSCIILLGKGSENYMKINGVKLPYEGDEFYARKAIENYK